MDKSVESLYEDTVIRLISRHKFFAHILLQLKTRFDPKFPTAGVSIRNSHVHMVIGSDFFKILNEDQRVFVLCYEMAHIVLGHLGKERFQNKKDHQINNIAMDIAIHEILTEAKVLFPEENKTIKPWTVESLRKFVEDDSILGNETAEYYFNYLKNMKNDMQEKIAAMPNFDVHDWLDEGSGENSNLGKALTVGILENAKRGCGPGDIPGVADLTIDGFKKSVVDWRAILRRFVASAVDHSYRTTRNKRNRRYGFAVPGKKRIFTPTIAFIVDTSGSMTEGMLETAAAEMVKLEKLGYEIWVIEADADVQKVPYEFKNRKFKGFKGGGGTLYQPALDAALRLNCDVAVYLTDMDPADEPLKPKFPVLWLRTAIGSFNPSFGKIIDIFEK